LIRQELEGGEEDDPETIEEVVSQVTERFDVDIPQFEEIRGIVEQDDGDRPDWREIDQFYESARSLFNDISIVVKITYSYHGHSKQFLFPGDLTNWSLLLSRHGDAIRDCILKVPHHGSHVYADQEDSVGLQFAKYANPHTWRSLPPPWNRLWERWYYTAREYSARRYQNISLRWPLLPFLAAWFPSLSGTLDSHGVYTWLRPKHALIYPYRSSFKLPRLSVRTAILNASAITSCNFFHGKVHASRFDASASCIDCYNCRERESPTVFEWL
jgi:hypothetical protein